MNTASSTSALRCAVGIGGCWWIDPKRSSFGFQIAICKPALCAFLCDSYLHFNNLESLELETFSDLPKLERL